MARMHEAMKRDLAKLVQRKSEWVDCRDSLPEPYTEVLVWVDGHRGPDWKNNHALVAYRTQGGKWFEERHCEQELIGVIKWTPIYEPA